jgi:hypothetical protein
MQIGMQRPGAGNGAGGEIDTDAVLRLQAGQQFAASTTQFQNPFAGWNQKLHELPVVLAIGGIEPVSATLLTETGFGIFQEFPLPRIVRR